MFDPPEEKYTINEVRSLSWARALEQDAIDTNRVTRVQLNAIAESVMRQSEKDLSNKSYKDYFLKRSQIETDKLESIYASTGKGITNPDYPSAFNKIGFLIIMLAVIVGIGTNFFSLSDEDRTKINLIVTLLLVLASIVWNFLIYCWSFRSIFFGSGFPGPVNKLTNFIKSKCTKHGGRVVVNFYQDWLFRTKYPYYVVSLVFQLAGLAFGIGLIIFMVGFGLFSAHTVYWSTDWDKEVLSILQWPIFPQLNNGVSATEWLRWLMKVIFCFICIPRAIFSLVLGIKIWFMRKNFPINLEPYYANWLPTHPHLSESPQTPDSTELPKPPTSPLPQKTLESLQPPTSPTTGVVQTEISTTETLQESSTDVVPSPVQASPIPSETRAGVLVLPFEKDLSEAEKGCIFELAKTFTHGDVNFDFVEDEMSPLPDLADCKAGKIWLVFPMESTPEEEVHIEYAASIKTLCKKAGILFRILVVTDSYEKQFDNMPDRIKQRRTNWSEQLNKVGAGYTFVNLSEKFDKRAIEKDWISSSHTD